ncbi:sulfite exporter TauE/SafE family protein [Mucilaginibacter koreensis]
MSDNEVAFFVGLFGSVHCIGMCGPLAFAVPVNRGGHWLMVADKLLYNLGRTLSYSLLGAIVGLAGRQLWLAGLQQWVSILSGVLILLASASRLFSLQVGKADITTALFKPFNRLLAYALNKKAGHLVIGMLNGFLPCGFVYLALIGAVNTNSVSASAQYMFWFGMGTMPLMLAATIGSGFITQPLRLKLNRLVPYVMVLLGCWFLLRGLNLNIPYLSPDIKLHGDIKCR